MRKCEKGLTELDIHPIPCGSVARHLQSLRILRKMDRYRETAYFRIEPWIGALALERLEKHALSLEAQNILLAVTHKPNSVKWPDWREATPKVHLVNELREWASLECSELHSSWSFLNTKKQWRWWSNIKPIWF